MQKLEYLATCIGTPVNETLEVRTRGCLLYTTFDPLSPPRIAGETVILDQDHPSVGQDSYPFRTSSVHPSASIHQRCVILLVSSDFSTYRGYNESSFPDIA